MKNKLTILTGKFSDAEKYLILKKYPEKKEDIKFYSEANYFQIHKLYYHHFFIGYVILFLGHHSLETNDVSIEDVGYLRDEELFKPLMSFLFKQVQSHKVFSFPIDGIYYDSSKFNDDYRAIFECLAFQEIKRVVCRA